MTPEFILRFNLLSSIVFLFGPLLWFSSYLAYSCAHNSDVSTNLVRVGQASVLLHALMEMGMDCATPKRNVIHGRYTQNRFRNWGQSGYLMLVVGLDIVASSARENSYYSNEYLVPCVVWGGGSGIFGLSSLDASNVDCIGTLFFVLGTLLTFIGGAEYRFSTDGTALGFGWTTVTLWLIAGIVYVVADTTRGRCANDDVDLDEDDAVEVV